ncbi:MAG: 4Fe-4S dicluster domain-containing protein [Deltaproteobacteria bacterium]|nr:4Fe-4S dicluster domain-containing protein [Deltaproteobacteria bacterium]
MKPNNFPAGTFEPNDGNAPLTLPCTRRQVLIWGGVAIPGWSVLSPFLVQGADRPLIIMEKAQGMVVADPVLCVGCGRCELACTEFNDGKASPSLSRIKVDRNLNFGARGATTWRAGHGNFGDGLVVQDLCRQCPHPVPCASICPENAIILSPSAHTRVIDPERCTGCKVCLQACPWEMISYDPDSRKATKCHLCQGKPKCVEACPAGSLSYVAWRDLTGKIPPRNLNPSPLPPQRALSCQECHLPGLPQNIRQTNAMMRQLLGGGRAVPERTGFKWIDLAGTVLIPLAIGSVLVHALVRRVRKK